MSKEWELTDEEMLQPIWDMGVELEKEGRMIQQVDRFQTIANAAQKKLVEWLNKQQISADDTGLIFIGIEVRDWQELCKELGIE